MIICKILPGCNTHSSISEISCFDMNHMYNSTRKNSIEVCMEQTYSALPL